jgi:chaperonin GroES
MAPRPECDRPGSIMVRRYPMKLRPLGDRVLVRFVEEQEMSGSIIVPETAKEKPTQGIVEAVGEGKITEKGDRLPMAVKVGDRILFGRYAGTEVRIEGTEYMVLRETEILAIL